MKTRINSLFEMYDYVASVLSSLGLTQADTAWSPQPEATRDRSFQLRPISYSPRGQGGSIEIPTTFEIQVDYQTRPEDELTVLRTRVMQDVDKISDAMSAIEEFDPREPISMTLSIDEDRRFISLTIAVRMAYSRNWNP